MGVSLRLVAMAALWLTAQSGADVPLAGNDPMSTVRSYIEAFNRADVKGLAENFAVPGSILDGMPPHVWQGRTATQDWFRDAQAMAKKQNVTEERLVVTGEPLKKEVTGKSAYIVLPVTFSYKMNGKLVNQTGAYFTIALTQATGAWRIASWAWTKGTTEGTPAF